MGGTDKLTLPLHGRPLLAHTVATFLEWFPLRGLAVSVSPGREDEFRDLLSVHGATPDRLLVLTGGAERQDSIRLALDALHERYSPAPEATVLIHDGARPFVDAVLFQALLDALPGVDGVLPATPVRDTVKRVVGDLVVRTEDRETLRMVQTPQAFPFLAIRQTHHRALAESFYGTDDASLVENYGGQIRWVPGPAHNLKVTVPEDIALLSQLAAQTAGEALL